MPHRPSPISWSAIDSARLSRFAIPAADRRTIYRAAAFAKLAADRAARASLARPLVVAGAYDRAAIMSAACCAAHARRAATGEPMALCMAAALKGTWQAAHAARARTAH